jgi:hypothetical protein
MIRKPWPIVAAFVLVACDPEDPAGGTWQPTSLVGAPSPRQLHVGVWAGDRMIIWGGEIPGREGFVDDSILGADDGAAWDPATDSWSSVSAEGAPSPREHAVAFWTGNEVLIWGGQHLLPPEGGSSAPEQFADGGLYEPLRDSWRPASTDNAPAQHEYVAAVWTGTKMILWGGGSPGNPSCPLSQTE